MIYIESPNARENQWSPLMMLSRDVELQVSPSSSPTVKPVRLQDRLEGILFEKLKTEGMNADTRLLVEQAQLFEGLPERLQDRLREAKCHEVLGDLNVILRERVLDITTDQDKLFERDGGYYLERARGNAEINLTNFLLRFDSNIVFNDSRDVFHAVRVLFKGEEIPMLLESNDLHNARNLLRTVQRLPRKDTDVQGLPVFTETAGRAANALMRYLKSQPGSLPDATGITNLGWSPNRQHFAAPYFVADADGVQYEELVFHPNNEILKHYKSFISLPRKIHEPLPLVFTNLIAQIVAMVFRSYSGIQAMAVPILREDGGERLLRNMFGSLGQTHPFHFNESQWYRGINTNGYPVYGAGADFFRTQQMKQAVFMLTERGQRIEEIFTDEVYDAAGQTLRQILHDVIEWMLTGQNTEFVYLRSVDPSSVLSKEGQRVIHEATGLDWHIRTPSYQVLDTLLENIPFEKTHEYFVRDLNKRRIELRINDLFEVDKTDLALELKQFASNVELTDQGISAVDADMETLATTYYQDTPRFEEIFEAPST